MSMPDNLIMALLGFIAALLVALKPILDLNTNITELKVSIDQFRESVNKLDSRITEHEKEIDKIKETVVDHEARLKNLER
jgi:peptidoglycan hydrolase CwlO-like protein